MNINSLKYITAVLKGEPVETTTVDWYEVLGLLYSHRIAGLFYSRAHKSGIRLPHKVERMLCGVFSAQKRRNAFMREELCELAAPITARNIPCVFPKGSFLSNMRADEEIYADGERVSNDIDIITEPSGITAVADMLKEQGFVQGRYDAQSGNIIEFSRKEILMRRMNRGETAPFVKLTGNAEFPFIEADINFSLGNVPSAYGDVLSDMVACGKIYDGKAQLCVTPPEMFFIHLVLHQYKECALYFMVERGKDLELYKLADILYFWRSGLLDKPKLREIIRKYGLDAETATVLGQVSEIFDTDEFSTITDDIACITEQPIVIDYATKKTYEWTSTVTERACAFDGRLLLKEVCS